MARKNPGGREEESGTIVIEIGQRRCPPIIKTGFPTMAAAHAWLRKTHCSGDCRDAGSMVIGFSGSGNYTAIRFCKPK